jgi:hypothetical protein
MGHLWQNPVGAVERSPHHSRRANAPSVRYPHGSAERLLDALLLAVPR